MTTQSPHVYARQHRPAAARTGRTVRTAPEKAAATPGAVQTRLPWWAVALPALAFAALLALLTAGSADASAAAHGGDWLGRRPTMAVPDLIHRLV